MRIRLALAVVCTLAAGGAAGQSGVDAGKVVLRSRAFSPAASVDQSFAAQVKLPRGAETSFSGLSVNADAARAGSTTLLSPAATRSTGWKPDDSVDPGKLHGLVQLGTGVKMSPALEEKLTAKGIKLFGAYGSGYAASFDQGIDLPKLQKQGLIRWAGPLNTADKVERALLKRNYFPWAKTKDGKIKLLVKLFPDVEPLFAKKVFSSVKVEARDLRIGNIWSLEADPAIASKLAELDIVESVEQGPGPSGSLSLEVLIDTRASLVQDAAFAPGVIRFGGLIGKSVKVGVAESDGISAMHPDFRAIGGGPSRLLHPRLLTPDRGEDHATHVASIIAGNGMESANKTPPFSLRGVAPGATIGDYPQFRADGESFIVAIAGEDMDLTNHSYVQNSGGHYDLVALSIDREIRGDFSNGGRFVVPRPQVWAVGNNGADRQWDLQRSGYYSTLSAAKNAIAVGSVDIDDRPSSFSSLGPTDDGRVKPDIVAPGCLNSRSNPWLEVVAAEPVASYYGGHCGTSQAAPVVSGTIALMLDQYRKTVGSGAVLESAEAKALLIQTARTPNAPNGHEGINPSTGARLAYSGTPNFVTGFGIVDAKAAVDLIADTSRWVKADNRTALRSDGERREWCFAVPPNTPKVKATLAWDDYTGVAADEGSYAEPVLVNDLDLVLIPPSGHAWLPWFATPPPIPLINHTDDHFAISPNTVRPATRAQDHLNNVEMISVSQGEIVPGTWRLSVRAYRLKKPSQRFSVAANFPLRSCGR